MKLTAFERFTMGIAPRWTLARLRARAAADYFSRHYEAAAGGRRTAGWSRQRGDANAVTGRALVDLRTHARDLVRNNAWAKRGQRVIANNMVGWGIVPKPTGGDAQAAGELWKAWADSTECDSEGRLSFYAMQHQIARSIVESGEVLIRRRRRRPTDGLTIPLQLQVLESDFLDTNKEALTSLSGGPIVQGVELDLLGRRSAYWLFPTHPGSSNSSGEVSRRIDAADIIHVFEPDRPGQYRGISWLAAAIVNLKDLDEYEDAELVKQKIAACFAAFVTDTGDGVTVGAPELPDGTASDTVETFEPGTIQRLPPGKEVTFGNPPSVTEGTFAARNLRRVAAGLGVTYEDLTGDYSQVNFSSARMSRIAHYANVRHWQWDMMIPLMCNGVWAWAMEAALESGGLLKAPRADWTAPPMPMIEPDKEGLAYQRLVRNGTMTPSEMVREQGGDPEAHWQAYADDLATLDRLGIVLDCDVRAVSQAGLTQVRAGGDAGGVAAPAADATPPAPTDATQALEIDVDVSAFEGLPQ